MVPMECGISQQKNTMVSLNGGVSYERGMGLPKSPQIWGHPRDFIVQSQRSSTVPRTASGTFFCVVRPQVQQGLLDRSMGGRWRQDVLFWLQIYIYRNIYIYIYRIYIYIYIYTHTSINTHTHQYININVHVLILYDLIIVSRFAICCPTFQMFFLHMFRFQTRLGMIQRTFLCNRSFMFVLGAKIVVAGIFLFTSLHTHTRVCVYIYTYISHTFIYI